MKQAMERQRIIEIIEAYRPGEGLESDPEVRQALELAAKDSELGQLRREIQAFDEAFGEKLSQIEVPEGLQASILAAAKAQKSAHEAEKSGPAKVIQWFYPATFAAAAAIIILLALSFTFWNRPGTPGPSLAAVEAGLPETVHEIYTSLKPSYHPSRGSDVLEFLKENGGMVPVGLPGNVAFDESFACDVVDVRGDKVSIICFKAPDKSNSMHLFTFSRSTFPDAQIPVVPEIRQNGDSCCATWLDEEQGQIHVLYSDKGEKNLRRVLDI
jgi:hypothetical protein